MPRRYIDYADALAVEHGVLDWRVYFVRFDNLLRLDDDTLYGRAALLATTTGAKVRQRLSDDILTAAVPQLR